MTELITMHTHSTFCNHAKDPLGDMVQAAVDAGAAEARRYRRAFGL